jgi:hypothetical protein
MDLISILRISSQQAGWLLGENAYDGGEVLEKRFTEGLPLSLAFQSCALFSENAVAETLRNTPHRLLFG